MANIATRKLARSENSLFDILDMEEESLLESWDGVPEFIQKKKAAAFTVSVNFRNKEDLDKFADIIEMPNLKLDGKVNKSVWYPQLKYGERGQNCLVVWMDEDDPAVAKLIAEEKK